MSHLAASLVGVMLLIVARGLVKRLERAWVAAIGLLLSGAVFSLAKGLDWEEAIILCLLAVTLWGFRDSFYRRPISRTFELSWNWIATVCTKTSTVARIKRGALPFHAKSHHKSLEYSTWR